MNIYEQREIEACTKLSALLDLPSIPGGDEMFSDGECFEPWAMFPCVYGSYSSDFDDIAITVLTNIRDGTFGDDDLACEMFREMLCKVGLCDYGTSPRVCFATERFSPLLPRLIERWAEYRELKWN